MPRLPLTLLPNRGRLKWNPLTGRSRSKRRSFGEWEGPKGHSMSKTRSKLPLNGKNLRGDMKLLHVIWTNKNVKFGRIKLLCVLYFGLPKRYPFFYKGRANRQLAWQYPAAWVQRNSSFLNPAIPSSFFLIRLFPTNFNSFFSCPQPVVANKKKVGWSWNSLLPAYPPLPFLAFSLLSTRRSSARTLLWLYLACSSSRRWDQSS